MKSYCRPEKYKQNAQLVRCGQIWVIRHNKYNKKKSNRNFDNFYIFSVFDTHFFQNSRENIILKLPHTIFSSLFLLSFVFTLETPIRYLLTDNQNHLSSDIRNCNFSFTNMSICQMQGGIRNWDNKKVGIQSWFILRSPINRPKKKAKKETSDRWLWN